MNTKSQKRWLVDAALFAGFIACFFLDLTGVALHQWLGLAAGIVAVYHLLTHGSWVSAVARRFFGRTSGRARLYFLIDALLLAGFTGMVVTGLVISTWLDLSLAAFGTWYAVHVLSSLATLLVLVLKIGLHAQWILAVGKKLFAGVSVQPMTPEPAPGRRAFIKLMGGVGVASLLAASQTFRSLAQSGEAGANTASSTTEGTSTLTKTLPSLSSASTSSICSVQCGRRCSYPGHCRRYVDQNSNGRCDLGECQS